MKYLRNLDIRMVRGPQTAELLREVGINVPNVYADPAILLPLIYNPTRKEPALEYSVIRHHADGTNCHNDINILTTDYKAFVDAILNSKKIISSSLHGIIIAEAYGVPAVLYIPKKSQGASLFKYQDYYYGTGRYDFPVVHSVEEGIKCICAEIPDFSVQKDFLLHSFPYDLWAE